MENPKNIALEEPCAPSVMAMLTRWAEAVHTANAGTRLIAQISHAGRQTPISVTGSAAPPSASALPRVKQALPVFNPSRAMRADEVSEVVERFAATAALAQSAGFDGVQIHAAHGYLLAQFLSPLSNQRTDRYGGSAENRRRLLIEIVRAVRATVRAGFVVGIKLNSADFQRGGFSEDESMAVVAELLALDAVDFLEVSGGSRVALTHLTNMP